MRTDYCGRLGADDVGRPVELCGWVATRREQGKHLAFVDLRDHTGLIQCVVDGASDLRSEYVVRIEGTVRVRPEGTANPAIATGDIEVGDCTVEILSVAEPRPSPSPTGSTLTRSSASGTAISTCAGRPCSATSACGRR